jgi:hypothetical protein
MRDSFDEPIWLLIGLGYPHRVDSVSGAYRVLLDNPPSYPDASYDIALRACRSAVEGAVDAATVRGILACFAQRRGILVPAPASANLAGVRKSGASAGFI